MDFELRLQPHSLAWFYMVGAAWHVNPGLGSIQLSCL